MTISRKSNSGIPRTKLFEALLKEKSLLTIEEWQDAIQKIQYRYWTKLEDVHNYVNRCSHNRPAIPMQHDNRNSNKTEA